jgi:medium-chain acyl-[acyl-carrier-protein] hydrolase
VFRQWPEALPGDMELRVVQLPGRGPRLREERFVSVPPLIEVLGEALRPLLDRPFAFFGHSLGAILAFELARSLREQALGPAHLFVSGNVAPQVPPPAPDIHQLPDAEFVQKIKDMNGVPEVILNSQELLAIFLPAIRSDFVLLETYRNEKSGPPLGCPITAFGGLQDPRTTREGLEAWRAQTTGDFILNMLRGGHFFIESERSCLIRAIVQKLLATAACVTR